MGLLGLPMIRRDNLPLSAKEAGTVMYVAMRTAEFLLRDAQVLYRSGSWVRAAGLGVLALEEIGKIRLIMNIVNAGTDAVALKQAWKNYRSHPAKSSQTLTPGVFSDEAARLEEQYGYGLDFDRLKQLAFYSNQLEDGSWVIPEQVVTQDHSSFVLSLASIMVRQALESYQKDQAGELQ